MAAASKKTKICAQNHLVLFIFNYLTDNGTSIDKKLVVGLPAATDASRLAAVVSEHGYLEYAEV